MCSCSEGFGDKAIKNDKTNAKLNDIDNVKFEVDGAEEQMNAWQHVCLKPDVIQRKGFANKWVTSTY